MLVSVAVVNGQALSFQDLSNQFIAGRLKRESPSESGPPLNFATQDRYWCARTYSQILEADRVPPTGSPPAPGLGPTRRLVYRIAGQ